MASWLLFAVLYPLFHGISNIVDKFLIEKKVKNPYSYSIIVGMFILAVVAVLFSIVGLPKTTGTVWLLAALAGVLYGTAYLIFYHLLAFAEISRVVSIIYIFPAFVAILSFAFIGERLSALKYFAIAAAIVGAVFIGIEKKKMKWKLTHAFWLIVIVALLTGSVDVIDKYVVTHIPYLQATALLQGALGLMLITPLFAKKARKQFKQAAKYAPAIILSESFIISGVVSFLIAASLAPISIVSALGTLQPAFVFFAMIGISLFAPKLLKEVVTPGVLTYKIIGILLIIAAAIVLGG